MLRTDVPTVDGAPTSSPSDPRAEYEARIARWSDAAARGERAHLILSNARLAVAAVAALVAWLALVRDALPPWALVVAAAAFLALVVAHARVLQRIERAARARRLYERGLDRLNGTWTGVGPDGARYAGDHPYARDLDLFGPASLFQLLDAARTEAGEDTLADWMRGPAPVAEIRLRQGAIEELRPLVDFREELAVLAAESHVSRTSALAHWAGAKPVGLTAPVGVLFAACAAVGVTMVALGLAGTIGSGPVVAWLVGQATVASIWRRRVGEVLRRIDLPAHDLALVSEVLARIERERFRSARLAALHAALAGSGAPPSRLIARLQAAVAWHDSTHNPYLQLTLLAYLLLIRGQTAVAIDRWHAAHRGDLTLWLTAVGELEALASLATYAYEHPDDSFPALVDEGSPAAPLVHADGLAHPLIPERLAVRNDVRLGGAQARVLIVSGSNMSGKSTLLRAVGVNVVLGLAGAPVRASSMRLSAMTIGATLRVEDSLVAGHSRFFTEILRIRGIVRTAREGRPLLFLLDEILHGTNSHDRRVGAQAIVRALVEAGAIGLVTTHDLALTEVAVSLDGRAANVHFEDRIERGRMVFDYRMRPGVVEHSNALALMREIGLDV